MADPYDAVIVGAGPNGLAAAVCLARAGRSVRVVERADEVGGGCRSEELTLPGFLHDTCSAIHPLAVASPFLRDLPLHDHGLEWIHPPLPAAHPLDDEPPAVLELSIDETADALDAADREPYRRLMTPLVRDWGRIEHDLLGPLPLWPAHPLRLARFGRLGLRSARSLAESRFAGRRARALLAGLAAHSILPLERPATAAFGLVLGILGHRVGWPLPRGGARAIARALAARLKALGGEIETGRAVASLDELPASRTVLLDLTPRQLLGLAGERLPGLYRRRLARYRYGPGVFKLDLALSEPVPWRDPECARAGTVHLGGTFDEVAAAEAAPWRGEHAERPFVLLAQPSLFDPGRAPEGRHTVWAYCHVPHGSTEDRTAAIEGQIERFAPGFGDVVLARHGRTAAEMEAWNPNYVGGDIQGGAADLGQLFTRPVARRVPYALPIRGLYLCSSSTPPGGGVHGMCGYHAARAALARELA